MFKGTVLIRPLIEPHCNMIVSVYSRLYLNAYFKGLLQNIFSRLTVKTLQMRDGTFNNCSAHQFTTRIVTLNFIYEDTFWLCENQIVDRVRISPSHAL